MNYSKIKSIDVANGPGVRVSLFVSGCRNHCKGCFQPETWDFHNGKPFTKKTEKELLRALRPLWIQGLSILGGEPMEPENWPALVPFLKRIRLWLPEKDVWLYTGYTYGDVEGLSILKYVDVLVDGPFIREEKQAGLLFRGSSNQRLLVLEDGKWNGEFYGENDRRS